MRILTIGTFDLLHEGHEKLFERCQGLGGEFVIGVNSDYFVTQFKGVETHESQTQRLVAAGQYGTVRLHNGDTEQLLLAIEPDIIVVGSDWARKDYLGQLGVTQDWLDEHDISILYVPRTPGVSSTQLRENSLVNVTHSATTVRQRRLASTT